MNPEYPSEKPSKRSWRRIGAWMPALSVLVLIGVIILLSGQISSKGEVLKEQKSSSLKTEQPLINVVTLAVEPDTLQDRISLPGVVKPWVKLDIVAEVRGKIIDKRVVEGQPVKKGEVIARIDDRDYRNVLASATATYEAAQAALKRLKALFADQLATQSQLDDAVARVKTSRAAVDNAALDVERCDITAPMDGIVDRLYIENGQFMGSGDPVAAILQVDRVKVTVGIPESDVDAVRRVDRVRVTIDALGGRTFTGVRHYLYKTADSFARLYNLEVAVDNPRGDILPDMFARVQIVKETVTDGLSVPLYALINRDGRDVVFVVDNGIARMTPVTVGIQDGWRVEIPDGLTPGDRVVVVGQRSITDGDAVNVVQTVTDPEELVR